MIPLERRKTITSMECHRVADNLTDRAWLKSRNCPHGFTNDKAAVEIRLFGCSRWSARSACPFQSPVDAMYGHSVAARSLVIDDVIHRFNDALPFGSNDALSDSPLVLDVTRVQQAESGRLRPRKLRPCALLTRWRTADTHWFRHRNASFNGSYGDAAS